MKTRSIGLTMSAAVLAALSCPAVAATYYFDFHFDDLTYNGRDYPAADLVYTGLLPGSAQGPTTSLAYYAGSLDGFAPAQLAGFVDGPVVSYSALGSFSGADGSVQGIYFLLGDFSVPGTYVSVASLLNPANDGAGRGILSSGLGQIPDDYTSGDLTVGTTPPAAPTPEPSTAVLLGTGVAGVWKGVRRERRKKLKR